MYNFAPTFCTFVPKYAADMLGKNYQKDTFDLSELDLHNGIEHDASFCREYLPLFFGSRFKVGHGEWGRVVAAPFIVIVLEAYTHSSRTSLALAPIL